MTEVSINNKIWGFKGAIGRREYILNSSYVYLFSALLAIPYIVWVFQHINEILGISNTLDILNIVPLYIKVLLILCWVIILPFNFGFYTRRLNDIIGKDSNFLTYFLAVGFILISYWVSLTGTGGLFPLFLIFVVHVLLWCLKGKVTGTLPKDEVKRFNWGAFWGTWIWGLINKSYQTLWAIPALILFPIFPYVQIICGIKGNEWAYEKAKNKELPIFHKGQKHQAVFWNIFAGVGVILLPILAIIIMTVAAIGYAVANPEKMEQAAQQYELRVQEQVDEYFDKYELSNDANKFYINPQKWAEMDYHQRYASYTIACNFVLNTKVHAKEGEYELKQPMEEKAMTKIYSTYNGEVLAEFDLNQVDTTDFKTIIETSKNAFHINENPKLP